MKLLVTCHFSGTCLQSENFRNFKSLGLFWLRNGQLWKQISRVRFGFCSTYIYSFVSFSMVYITILSLLQFLNYRTKCGKILWKHAKFLTLMDRHKNTRGSSTLGYGQCYPPRSPLSNDKKSSYTSPNKIFRSLTTYMILRTSATFGVREGGRGRSVECNVRISPKIIPTADKDCRSLSHTILKI
jgi:hypothetical protein